MKRFKTFQVIIFLSLTLLFPLKTIAADSGYCIRDYQNILLQLNEEFGTNLKITDMQVFVKNILNKLTPEEYKILLENTLVKSNKTEYFINSTASLSTRAMPNENVKYYADIYYGKWSSKVNAIIETKFFADGSSSFVKFINAGYRWDETYSGWLFKPTSMSCTEFGSDVCKVTYSGCWKVPSTGVTDLTLYTYNITFTPN